MQLSETEQQYFTVHEKSIVESARCEEALERKQVCKKAEAKLDTELSRLKRELAQEERKLQVMLCFVCVCMYWCSLIEIISLK